MPFPPSLHKTSHPGMLLPRYSFFLRRANVNIFPIKFSAESCQYHSRIEIFHLLSFFFKSVDKNININTPSSNLCTPAGCHSLHIHLPLWMNSHICMLKEIKGIIRGQLVYNDKACNYE